MLLIVQRLRPCLVMPGEMLVREGTFGIGLFLLMKGAVEATRDGKLLVVLLATAAFGETALRSESAISNVTVRALRFCETTILMREDWALIEQLNPQIKMWLEVYIGERDRKLNDKRVQLQSQQTKKATMRFGGSCHEWDVSNPPTSTKTALKSACTRCRVSMAFGKRTRQQQHAGSESETAKADTNGQCESRLKWGEFEV